MQALLCPCPAQELTLDDAVGLAYARYGQVLEAKRAGTLPEKRKMASDFFISLAAKGIEEQKRRHQTWAALLQGYRETPAGMMDNMREPEEEPTQDTEQRR